MLRVLKLKTIRPDYLMLGYFCVTVDKDSVLRASQQLLKHDISARIRDCTIVLPSGLYKDIDRILEGVEYTKTPIRGLFGAMLRARKRYGIMLAVACVFFLFLFLNSLVWDVRIEGCESGRENEVLAELESVGLSVGSRWRRINKGEIEAKVLATSDEVSWININRRGTVAYVKVIDKVVHDIEKPPVGYANVVAERDCIIEEITVKRGFAVVKVGQSVRKGQLLISGVIPSELGGGYCYAEGSVLGRYTDTVSVSVPVGCVEREYTNTRIGAAKIKIFGFYINIFKNYGNSIDSCDIIEKTKHINIGGKRLPITLDYSEIHSFTEWERPLSAAELTERASDALHEQLLDMLSSSELVSVTTDGEFTDDGYDMHAYAVVRGEVGSTQEFEFDLE